MVNETRTFALYYTYVATQQLLEIIRSFLNVVFSPSLATGCYCFYRLHYNLSSKNFDQISCMSFVLTIITYFVAIFLEILPSKRNVYPCLNLWCLVVNNHSHDQNRRVGVPMIATKPSSEPSSLPDPDPIGRDLLAWDTLKSLVFIYTKINLNRVERPKMIWGARGYSPMGEKTEKQ